MRNGEFTGDRIIRSGNHFLRLAGKGWILIDGPWYEMISNRSDKFRPQPCQFAFLKTARPYALKCPPRIPEYIDSSIATWYPVAWHPGYLVSQMVWHSTFRGERWQKSRVRTGWMFSKDGGLTGLLPCFINHLEYDLEYDLYERLI